uniref:Orotidine 5'-phosphate decarboxylase n=2 Tax=Haptolina brevifila TaxID=156173 RepID=A0A7S2HS71_9EUKA
MDGVVCSAREIEPIRKACGAAFTLVVPGIRPAGSDHGDQKRVVTPGAAITSGATSLVVGRPISQAPEPVQAAAAILEEISAAAMK